MKKRLLSLVSIMLAALILALSLTSCSLTEANANRENTLPNNFRHTSGGKISYDAETYNGSGVDRFLMPIVSITAKESPESTSSSRGSGVIYQLDKSTGSAYIITNHHVVYLTDGEICADISVMLYGLEYEQYKIPASYVGGSMQYDIAVLKITNSEILSKSSAVEAKFADSELVSVLDIAVVVGNAQGVGISATAGSVSVASEYLRMTTVDSSMKVNVRVIRTDAAINPGNSGGGLFNNAGHIIGIVNAKSATGDSMGFAIPSNVAVAVAENIIYFCDGTSLDTVYKCTLGIEVETAEIYTYYDQSKGRIVTEEVVKVKDINSNIDRVNDLVHVGDTVVSITIDGVKTEITKKYQIVEAMLNVREDSTVIVEFCRHDGYTFNVGIYVDNSMIYSYK